MKIPHIQSTWTRLHKHHAVTLLTDSLRMLQIFADRTPQTRTLIAELNEALGLPAPKAKE